jgi:hypothetical protein
VSSADRQAGRAQVIPILPSYTLTMPDSNLHHYRPPIRLLGFATLVAALVLLTFAYRWLFQQKVTRTLDCFDKAASAQEATSALTAVDKYAGCMASIGGGTTSSPTRPARCRYAGTWTATRGSASYEVTLNPDGSFSAEPGQGVAASEPAITGAWAVAGNALAWAYDSGAVWPPDINPIIGQSDNGFTLREVNGMTTQYSLVARARAEACAQP